jgi:hypothetical protein
MEGCRPEELFGDPTRWANAVPRAAHLVNADAVAVGFRPDLFATAFKNDRQEPWRDGQMESLFETVRRLVETLHPTRDVIVALCGPATMTHHLFAAAPDRASLDLLKPGMVKTLEMLCASRPDMVVLDEFLEGAQLVATPDFRRFCNTLKNVTEYFNVALGLRVSGYKNAEEIVVGLGNLKIDHLLIGTPADGEIPGLTPELLALARDAGWKSLGFPVEGNVLLVDREPSELPCYYTSAEQSTDAERLRRYGAELTRQIQ